MTALALLEVGLKHLLIFSCSFIAVLAVLKI
jgi:hypothetical protein